MIVFQEELVVEATYLFISAHLFPSNACLIITFILYLHNFLKLFDKSKTSISKLLSRFNFYGFF